VQTKTCSWQGCPTTSSTPGSPGWMYYADMVSIVPEGLYCPIHSEWIERQAYGDWEEAKGLRVRPLRYS
jgi:hypothetical protein